MEWSAAQACDRQVCAAAERPRLTTITAGRPPANPDLPGVPKVAQRTVVNISTSQQTPTSDTFSRSAGSDDDGPGQWYYARPRTGDEPRCWRCLLWDGRLSPGEHAALEVTIDALPAEPTPASA